MKTHGIYIARKYCIYCRSLNKHFPFNSNFVKYWSMKLKKSWWDWLQVTVTVCQRHIMSTRRLTSAIWLKHLNYDFCLFLLNVFYLKKMCWFFFGGGSLLIIASYKDSLCIYILSEFISSNFHHMNDELSAISTYLLRNPMMTVFVRFPCLYFVYLLISTHQISSKWQGCTDVMFIKRIKEYISNVGLGRFMHILL